MSLGRLRKAEMLQGEVGSENSTSHLGLLDGFHFEIGIDGNSRFQRRKVLNYLLRLKFNIRLIMIIRRE